MCHVVRGRLVLHPSASKLYSLCTLVCVPNRYGNLCAVTRCGGSVVYLSGKMATVLTVRQPNVPLILLPAQLALSRLIASIKVIH